MNGNGMALNRRWIQFPRTKKKASPHSSENMHGTCTIHCTGGFAGWECKYENNFINNFNRKIHLLDEIPATETTQRFIDYENAGMTFQADAKVQIPQNLKTGSLTFEALFSLPAGYKTGAGVLIGNYDNSSKEQINVEIYTNGKPRLYYKVKNKAYTINFTQDVRSDKRTHMAIVVDGKTGLLYLNGIIVESVDLPTTIPSVTNGYCIGGDNRTDNTQYFKGQIYGIAMFSDIRTQEEIAMDHILVPDGTESLLYAKYFAEE